MPMTLYCLDGSPPVRSVYLCLEALGLQAERKTVNLFEREHLNAEFIKINPQHTVPTLDDNGFIIWDSHAINAYLVTKYGKDDTMYPKDIQARAIVDQRLHFDTGVLFPRMRDILFPILFLKGKEIPDEKRQKVLDAYEIMDKFLDGRDYLAANHYTIADFCCVATVSQIVEALGISADSYPRVKAWYQRCKDNLPGYQDAQNNGLALVKGLVDSALGR